MHENFTDDEYALIAVCRERERQKQERERQRLEWRRLVIRAVNRFILESQRRNQI